MAKSTSNVVPDALDRFHTASLASTLMRAPLRNRAGFDSEIPSRQPILIGKAKHGEIDTGARHNKAVVHAA